MGLSDWLFGSTPAGVASNAISGTLSGIGDAAIKIRTAITGIDPAKQAELETHLADIEARLSEAQNKVNEVEAGSGSLFVAGWRPFTGWLCALGVGYTFLAQPLLAWASVNYKFQTPPIIDTGSLMALIMGMLGLGGLRTYEKATGSQSNH